MGGLLQNVHSLTCSEGAAAHPLHQRTRLDSLVVVPAVDVETHTHVLVSCVGAPLSYTLLNSPSSLYNPATAKYCCKLASDDDDDDNRWMLSATGRQCYANFSRIMSWEQRR